MLPDVINIKRNPTGYIAAASAVYAATLMISNAVHHHGVIDTPTIIAAVTAVSALLTRQVVTPVAQPKDGNGIPLVPVTQAAAVLADVTRSGTGAVRVVQPEEPSAGVLGEPPSA
jgi:hypothetical protein